MDLDEEPRLRNGEAEDLAQETLVSICAREDYSFAKEEDFLCVCYGFARRIFRAVRHPARAAS